MSLGFFFGAGAEIGYGMPSGGHFALDLFRHDVSQEKEELRTQLTSDISRQSPYATFWLPEEFWKKRIHAFGKNEFAALVESSIEYKKSHMIDFLNSIDQAADDAMRKLGITRERLSEAYERQFNRPYGEHLYSQIVRINPLLAERVQLFDSEFYSALLDLVPSETNLAQDAQRYAAALLQLLVGAHGQELVQRLNQEIFVDAPDDIPIFDDVSGMFRLEFSKAGVAALDILLSDRPEYNIAEDASVDDLMCALANQILEDLFAKVLDYQNLIDSHFRYLFNPRAEWAKFTKMVIFLNVARKYIAAQLESIGELPDSGYYHDVLRAYQAGQIGIGSVGTSNYNSLFETVMRQEEVDGITVHHLNGGVNDFYDPYKNAVITCNVEDVPADQIYVPFILTQSGLKPLTSVGMSRRYVKLFDELSACDAVVCVGYGFNVDDSHINGLFREIVETNGKTLYWVTAGEEAEVEHLRRQLVNRLRVSPVYRNNLRVIPVDRQTRACGDQSWIAAIREDAGV